MGEKGIKADSRFKTDINKLRNQKEIDINYSDNPATAKDFWKGAEVFIMSNHVFIVSEWLAKEGHEAELYEQFKKLLGHSLKSEAGCLNARVTRQVEHPGAPTKSKYSIVLLQEYADVEAFNFHCNTDYVAHFFKTYIENQETAIVEDWRCRLFSEG